MKRGSTLAELLVCLAVVATGAVIFWPRGEIEAGEYGLELILAVIACGTFLVCAAADWKLKRLAFCLPLYYAMWITFTTLFILIYNPRLLQCAETLLR